MKEYKVLIADVPDRLETKVIKCLKKGYIPMGGVVFIEAEEGYYYAQAVILKKVWDNI